MCIKLSGAQTYGQNYAQQAAMTHARMMQQMDQNFHMMTLSAMNRSITSTKKQLKDKNKFIKKDTKKIAALQKKLGSASLSDAKKKKLKRKIKKYESHILENQSRIVNLEEKLKQEEELKAKKKAEKQAGKKRKTER